MPDTTRIGIPSCAIRLICHVPVGLVSVLGTRLYHAADELDQSIFDVIPQGRVFFRGVEFVARAATAMFVWNIIQWLFTFIWDNAILAAVGVVDLGLAATLLTGVVFQSRFIPQSYSQCRNAASWKNGVDGRNFFAVFATAAGQNDKDPDTACRDFVRIWILAIVLVTLYIICGTINLLVGLAEKHILPPDPIVESRKKQPYRQPFQPTSWPDPPKNPYPRIYGYLMLYCLLSDALYYFWTTFRFGLRCLRKYLSFKIRSPPSFPVDDEEANAEHHCVPKKNAPAAVGEVVFSNCFVCAARICTKCQYLDFMDHKTTALNHVYKCHQWCTRCMFFKSKSFLGLGQTPSFVDVGTYSSRGENKPLCQSCHDMTSTKKIDLLERRQRAEIWRLNRLPMLCRACEAPISMTGPRWWVNPGTTMECKHVSHPRWVG